MAATASGPRSSTPTRITTCAAAAATCAAGASSSHIARKGVEGKTRLGRHRWVVERTLTWLHSNRRLAIRYEREDLLDAAQPGIVKVTVGLPVR